MAGIPFALVASQADLQLLLALAEPRDFAVTTIYPVREAPLFPALVMDLLEAGWVCENLAPILRAATFAATLEKLAVGVFPVLLDDPHDLVALRRLRSCGHAALKVRQSSAAEGGDLYTMAGRLSNCLERMARKAIKELQDYTVPAGWIVRKANEVEQMRADRIDFTSALPPQLPNIGAALPPQLPRHIIATIKDVHELFFSPAVPLHEIDIVAVEVLSDAPFYHDAVTMKMKELAPGWTCPNLAQLHQAARFVRCLADLADNIIAPLMYDPEDRASLRRLRACGQRISRIRRRAHGALANVMSRYANYIPRAARKALNPHTAYVLSDDWLTELAFRLYEDQPSTILF
jgi:hypothetical protein